MFPRFTRRRLLLLSLPLVCAYMMAMSTQGHAADGLVAVPDALDVGAAQGQGPAIVAVENGSGTTVVLKVVAERLDADGTYGPAPELVAAPAAFELAPWGNRMILTGVHPSMGCTMARTYRLRLIDVHNPGQSATVVAVNWLPTAGAATIALRMDESLDQPATVALIEPSRRVAATRLQVAGDMRVPRNLLPAAWLPGDSRGAAATMITTNVVVDAVPIH